MHRVEPHYLRLKRHIAAGIADGTWQRHDRIPSEGELTRSFGLSRMTVNRALRELAQEGLIVREQGRGSFVAPGKAEATMLAVRGIRHEIQSRGAVHQARVLRLLKTRADGVLAERFGLAVNAILFRSQLLHCADGVPLQLEDRWVNPALAPDYLHQDLADITPYEYLSAVAPLERAEHVIEAELPDMPTARLLGMPRTEPLLVMTRRTWSSGQVASFARLAHPASRYQLRGQFDVAGHVLAE
jgi:GntR family histidine utilization transcriptional repressor